MIVTPQMIDLKGANSRQEASARKEVDVLKSIKHPNIMKYIRHFTGKVSRIL